MWAAAVLQYPVVVEEEISNLVSPVLCCLGHSATLRHSIDLYAILALEYSLKIHGILFSLSLFWIENSFIQDLLSVFQYEKIKEK